MFLDASAIVAMIAGEPDARSLADRMQRARRRVTSPLAVWEAVVALSRLSSRPPLDVRDQVGAFLDIAAVEVLAVPPEVGDLALDAFYSYGKGRHPAGLNFGDCFAYACARHYRQPLLYKGDDFSLTDIERA